MPAKNSSCISTKVLIVLKINLFLVVCKHRGRLSADNCRGFMNQRIILQGVHHKQGKVHPPGEVAFKNWVTHVPAPYRQALTLAFFKVAPTNHGPACIAGKHPSTGFHLVIQIHRSKQSSQLTEDPLKGFEFPGVLIPAVH